MKRAIRTGCGAAAAVVAFVVMAGGPRAWAQDGAEGAMEKFTATDGRVVEATIVGKTETTVSLKLASGQVAEVPLERLVEADRERVRAWDGAKAIFLEMCRSLSVRELLELRGYESFVVDIEGNHVYVDGKLNGKPARFMIDTGAATTLLHLQSAEAAGCEVGPMDEKVYGLGGEAPAAYVKVPTMEIGQTLIKDQEILAADLFKDRPSKEKDHDALFGAEFLAQLTAVLDYKEQRIFLRPDLADGGAGAEGDQDYRIFRQKDGKTIRGKIVEKTVAAVSIEPLEGAKTMVAIQNLIPEDAEFAYTWSEAGEAFRKQCKDMTVEELLSLRDYEAHAYERNGMHIFLPGKINGKETPMMIDSGAGLSVLDVPFAEASGCKLGGFTEVLYGVGGAVAAAPTDVTTVEVGTFTLRQRKLLSTDLFPGLPGRNYGIIFGADFLRELNAVISYREGRIMLKGG